MKEKLIKILDAIDQKKMPIIVKSLLISLLQKTPNDTLESFVTDMLTMFDVLSQNPVTKEILDRRGVDIDNVRQFIN